MKRRIAFFGLAAALLAAALIRNNVFLLLGAEAVAFYAAIEWW